MHILIVEDEPISSAMLAGWARQQGWRATEVGSTVAADAALATGAYDLVVSDVHLPGNDRLEWIERITAQSSAPPVILITGNPELETTLRAANLPVAGYLVKPPDLSALSRLALSVGVEARQRRELRALAVEVSWLLANATDAPDPVRERLMQVSQLIAVEAGRNLRRPGANAGSPGWREAIHDTIATLEKTKGSFRSKELGSLRQRLQRFLAHNDSN